MLNGPDSNERRPSIFKPSGQIGLVCDGEAFYLNNLGKTSFIIASTLRQFVVYESLSLKVVFISLPLKYNIKCLAAKYENVFLVLKDDSLYCFHKYEHREIKHEHKSEIIDVFYHEDTLVTYSSSELITYTKEEEDGTSLANWRVDKVICPDEQAQITTVLGLDGMNNKVLVGLSDSRMILVNLKSAKVIHKFSPKNESSEYREEEEKGITVISQSWNKSSGVVGVGYKNGYVAVVDVYKDQLLGGFQLSKRQKEAVSMVFVQDNLGITSKLNHFLSKPELLVVGAWNGDLVVFDLSNFTIISCLEGAHMNSVKKVVYIENNKFLVSLGENEIVAWNMDSEKSFLRELKSRRGFVGRVDILRPYDEEEHDILVCTSKDNKGYLGKMSTIQQQQSVNFSTKVAKGKIKKITGLSSSYQRHYDWPNIVTCHANTHQVHVWSGFKKALIEKVLKVPELKEVATAVCVTKCGNYAIVGYENGQMHLFTLQNCNYDSEFVRKEGEQELPAHTSKVINISLVGNSKVLSISNSKKDRSLRTWDVIKVKLESEYEPELEKGCNAYMASCGNFLTALACTDNNVYILDVPGKMIIRKISYLSEITSMKFHMNDSWLLLATERETMMIYDVLAACYVDYVKFMGKVVDLNIESSGSYLLVSNESTPGMIQQYSNKHAFELFPKSILYRDLPRQPIEIDIPSKKKEEGEQEGDKERESEENIIEEETFKSREEQIDKGIITLSGVSSSKLQTILYLDQIKEKSKPVEAPKQKEELPFFLPTTYKDGQLVFVEPEVEEVEKTTTRESLLKKSETETEFEKLLNSKKENEVKYEEMMEYLMKQTPAAIHLSLALFSDSKMEETLGEMLKFFEYHIKKKDKADALQVFLHLFLNFHSEKLSTMRNDETKDTMERLKNNLKEDYKWLQEKFDRISCYIKFFTHLQME